MFNFNINQQVVTFLNQRFGEVGEVTAFEFSRGNVSISLALKGEPEVVTLEVADLCYSVSDGKMNLHYSELRATKPWVQEIFRMVSEKTGRTISFPDSMKLMPLKMLLPTPESNTAM